LAYTVVQ